jgi:hypothetical protein
MKCHSLLGIYLLLGSNLVLAQADRFAISNSEQGVPTPKLAEFRTEIEPLFKKACLECHGPKKQKGRFRIDTLNPDLFEGEDVNWWLEVFDVLSNGEMPPEDADVNLTGSDRGLIIDWLSSEIQIASQIRRSEQGHSSFRRMTRYEYNFALQDLIGLPNDFSGDLPPETVSEDGFENSSEMLQMSVAQFEQYRELARHALQTATVRGNRPQPIYYGISMEAAAAKTNAKIEADRERARKRNPDRAPKTEKEKQRQARRNSINPREAHFKNLTTGHGVKARWNYGGVNLKWAPSKDKPDIPPISKDVAIIPENQRIIFDLGDALPASGNLRVRIRASRISDNEEGIPTLRLFFGHQASNNSAAAEKVKKADIEIAASPDAPQFYQWDFLLSEVVRNPFRGIQKLGQVPNPAEYLMFRNISATSVGVQIDYLEVTTPTHDQWPPNSHAHIFPESPHSANESAYAREVLTQFIGRAWRRPATDSEIDQKMALFDQVRPICDDFQEAMIEVMSAVIASPKFLYLVRSHQSEEQQKNPHISDHELATRLSFFLWCSTPDEELLNLADEGKLRDTEILITQTKRLLADPKTKRFTKHFVRQWLGLQLLDYLEVDEETYGRFDPILKEAMQEEPIVFFEEVMEQNNSIMDFLHADYAIVNDRLASHYRLPEVNGSQFRKVSLNSGDKRGGLLTQAGLLAMNSDGKDSHPLKRGIWLLEKILNDPPPPPPPAVPEIDLTDPSILKLTQKERMEDHRNDPACISCHAKIDPWGIAFENFDATGLWRDQIGEKPVDASSLLFNQQELNGIDGLKQFLLENRQDQFARAMVHKMCSYALGRPLSFADRSSVDQITSKLRDKGDGLTDLIILIVKSDLFHLR